jgi:hypothetical protein
LVIGGILATALVLSYIKTRQQWKKSIGVPEKAGKEPK